MRVLRVGPGVRVTTRPTGAATAIVLVLLLVAFALHAAVFGAWIVDDAGISMAYAQNLADGRGLVAQPGAGRVEGYSNPAWVLLLAGLFGLGLIGRFELLGLPDYVIVTKGLAVAAHAVVLVCLLVVIDRVLRTARGQASPTVVLTVWATSALLLTTTPSYVIWMVSGLENPLLAATVAALAAITVLAVERPSRRLALAAGVLAGLAATTRPDGIVYLAVLPALAVLAARRSRRERWVLLGTGAAGGAAIVGGLLTFRLVYFGAWLPNTAVAKGQDPPTFGDLLRLAEVGSGFGPWLLAIGTLGVVVAVLRRWRVGDGVGLRTATGGLVVLVLSVVAFVVLNPDWMTELRFLTPAWPLLSAAVVLGVLQLIALAPAAAPRALVTAIAVAAFAVDVPGRVERSQAYAATPNVPLCYIAERYGAQFDAAARLLELDPRHTTLLLPDMGGTLLVSDLEVIDLAGLADDTIARLRRAGDRRVLADFILADLRPTFIHVHGPWVRNSGLARDGRLRRDYVELVGDRDFVRRDALTATTRRQLPRIRAELERTAAAADAGRRAAPRRACAALLFGVGSS